MKKLLCAFLAMALVILPVGGSMAAYAEDAGKVTVSTYSAGTSFDTAAEISLNTTYSGEFTESEEYHYYKLTPDTAGRINITLTTDTGIDDLCAYLYDESRDCIWSDDFSGEGGITIDETLDLTAGTYYFVVENDYGTGSYDFEISHESANESFAESQGGSNNGYNMASVISLNTTYTGQLAENDNEDWYKVELTSAGKINITLSAEAGMDAISCYLCDASRTEIWGGRFYRDGSSRITIDETTDTLSAGTYYLRVKCADYYDNNTGVYTFKLQKASVSQTKAQTITLKSSTSKTIHTKKLKKKAQTSI